MKLTPKTKDTIGCMAEDTLTIETLVASILRLSDSKRATSGFSCAYALMTRMPEMFSCTRSDTAENASCTRRKRARVTRPSSRMSTISAGMGARL